MFPKHMFQIFFQSYSYHICFYIILQPIVGKVSKESYNFVVGSTSIIIHMQTLCLNKISNTFIPRENMVDPNANLGMFFLGGQLYARGKNLHCVLMGSNYVPLEANVSKILCDHNFGI
jgi:hypothetical protein